MGKSEYQKLANSKKTAKTALYKIGYKESIIKDPLLIIVAPKAGARKKEREAFLSLLEGLLVLSMKVIVVDDEQPADALKRPAGHITWVSTEDGRNDPKIDEYLMAADMVLAFEEDHKDLQRYMEKGAVVIGHEKSPLLQNYHPNEETGNSFTFRSSSPWDIFRAVVRAYETFRFPFDWGNIMRGVLKGL